MSCPPRASAFVLLSAALGALGACASAPVQPPTMQVAGLRLGQLGLTGISLDVNFRVRNPNPKAIDIERFEYDLFLNGQRLGKGYEPRRLKIRAYADEQVVSRFDLNLLSLAGAVKAVLDEDLVDARVEGVFFIKGSESTPFQAQAQVSLHKRGERPPN